MKKISFLLAALLIFGATAFALWDNFRDMETMRVVGSQLNQFVGKSVDQLFVFCYDQNQNRWQQITHQLDEKDGGDNYFINPNRLLDHNDELFFMARDAGDKAFNYRWIEDYDSKNYNRYEIEIIDPLNPDYKKFVYVYHSTTFISATDLPVYMNYIAPTNQANDQIIAAGYIEEHHTKGFPQNIKIPGSAGGSNIDFLDRQKARVKGTYKVSFLSYNYKMDEDDLQLEEAISYITGPIRTVRDIKYKTSIAGLFSTTVGTFKYQYYPYHIISFGTNKTLSSDYGIKLIRQSFDLNSNAIGMRFIDDERDDVIIDGVSEIVNKNVYPIPDINWYMYSGDPGTMLIVNEFEALSGATARFYYRDVSSGGTSDGTDDTGDGKSYGDAGIRFDGDKIQGKFSIPYTAFFLPANQTQADGFAVVDNYQNPLAARINHQYYQVPVEILVSLPDTSIAAGIPAQIPIILGEPQGESITACRFVVKFDSQIVRLTGATQENSLTANWQPATFSIEADSLIVEVNGTTPLTSAGHLIYLKCLPVGAVGEYSQLNFAAARLNNGYPFTINIPGSVTILPPPQVAVSLPDTSSPETSTIAIPLTIGDVTGLGVTSCEMEIRYNKLMLSAEDVILDGTIAEDWIASVHYKIGAVVISMNGETPLEGGGLLSRLQFRVSGKAGDLSALHFQNFQFNEGIPVALTRDGSLRVSALPPEQISVSIADTTVRSGARLAIPIKISSLDNVKIYNYRIQLDFDGQVLNFIKVDTTETISSLWSLPSVTKLDNSITITAFGTEALSGAGKLINLIFDVIGFDGTVSELRFANMSVSASSVELILQNGIVFVEGVIPVELSSFSVISDRDQIHLSWTTESELNNYGFEIQRKTSPSLDWQSIGFISGAGTTALPQFYQYTDRKLSPGQYFYRLKQIDFDGEFAFSALMSAQISAPERMVLHQNYPNPFNAATVIEYEIPENINRVTAVIYNILGQPIRRLMDNASLESGVHQLVWDGVDDSGNRVASGIYYIQISADDHRLNRKMIFMQ